MLKLYLWAFTSAQLDHLGFSNWIWYKKGLYRVAWIASDCVELSPV